MILYIPTKIIELVDLTINKESDLINITEKQKVKLSKTLIKLWLYIYQKQRNNEDIINLKGYTNINSKELKANFEIEVSCIRLGYKQLLKMLEEVNLISINNKYSSGSFSQSYRITTEFINNDYKEIEIDFDKLLEGFHNKSYWLNKYPKHTKQIEDLYKVEIDLSSYVQWLKNNIGKKLKPKMGIYGIEETYLTTEKAYDFINDVIKVNYKNIWVKVSNEGRFYNSITNLSSTTIPFIRIKRKEIIEIDIANCQPLILSKLINNTQYRKDCEDGIFYDKLSKELNTTRDESKLLSYKYIFFNNNKLKSGRIYDSMVNLYGDVIEQINDLRGSMEIAKEMQKIESSIFVDKIGKMNIDMMIRHDSVSVVKEDYDIIKLAVIKEFNKIGLKPTIKPI
jgi:hypothetical protein